MPRTYKKKGVHTSPETAGAHNMVNFKGQPDDTGQLDNIIKIRNLGRRVGERYKGQWTEEELTQCIADFFDYCNGVNLKPTPSGLAVYLDTFRETLLEWKNNPSKYGYKSYLIKRAYETMAMVLESRIDSYPTGSIFLLKASHGFVDVNKVEVTANKGVDQNEIDEALRKLGLDK